MSWMFSLLCNYYWLFVNFVWYLLYFSTDGCINKSLTYLLTYLFMIFLNLGRNPASTRSFTVSDKHPDVLALRQTNIFCHCSVAVYRSGRTCIPRHAISVCHHTISTTKCLGGGRPTSTRRKSSCELQTAIEETGLRMTLSHFDRLIAGCPVMTSTLPSRPTHVSLSHLNPVTWLSRSRPCTRRHLPSVPYSLGTKLWWRDGFRTLLRLTLVDLFLRLVI